MKSILLITLMMFALLPAIVHAGDLAQVTYRGNAVPGGVVSVRLSSPYADTGEMDVIWYVDGVVVAHTTADKEQQVHLGEIGSPVKVTAIITYRGAEYKEELPITPSLIDVLWEARTSVPPFYRGKALPSHDSMVRVMAIPRFASDDVDEPGYADFSWTKDKVVSIGNGVGAQGSQFLAAWPGRANTIGVKASAGDHTVNGSVSVQSRAPMPLFYEISPTEGMKIFRSLFGTVSRADAELLVGLVPMGVSLSDVDKDRVQYSWKVGGATVSEGDGRDFMSIRLSRAKDPTKTGTVEIDANVQSTANVMQAGEGKFLWNFTK